MRRLFFFLLIGLICGSDAIAQISMEAYERWHANKYSMFIHFGLYSELGGVWEGKPVTRGYSEQIQSFAGIFSDWYAETAKYFNPALFNADSIAVLAKDAGMRSIVFTTKHHDGFCMFRTFTTDYNSWEALSVPRDFVKELSEACKKEGLSLGLYFSNIDWHFPGAYPISSHNCDFIPPSHFDLNKAQVTELLTYYGPISELWFDMGSLTPEQSREMYSLVHRLQPDCMVSGRLGNDAYDFSVMADNTYPDGALQTAWQTPASMFDETWSFRSWQERGNVDKKVAEKLNSLIAVVSHGGNFLLNIGPKGDGSVVPFESEVLLQIGDWLQKNGEAIYGTEASPYREQFAWGYMTRKGKNLFLIVSENSKEDEIKFDLPNELQKAVLLTDQSSVQYTREGNQYTVQVPEIQKGRIFTVIALSFRDTIFPVPVVPLVQRKDLILTANNATPFYSYSCFDYYSNYRSVVAYNWDIQILKNVQYLNLIYTSHQIGRELNLVIDGGKLQTSIKLEQGEKSALPVKKNSIRFGEIYIYGPGSGSFDAPVDQYRLLSSRLKPETREGEIATSILSSYYLVQEIESDKTQEALFDIRSGNGIEIVLNGETVLKHLNNYRCQSRDEKVLLSLKKGKNEIIIRYYNRFEKNMPWKFTLSDEQEIYTQSIHFPLGKGLHNITIRPLHPASTHADIELSDFRLAF